MAYNTPETHNLISLLREFVRRYPNLSIALVVHALLLVFFWRYGNLLIENYKNETLHTQLPQSHERATSALTQSSADRIQKIRQLMEEASLENNKETPTDANKKEDPKNSIQEATHNLAEIEQLEQKQRAKKLADVLNISKEEALKKIQNESPSSANSSKAPTNASTPTPPSAEELKKMEANAVKLLKAFQQQMVAEQMSLHQNGQANTSNSHNTDNQENSGTSATGSQSLTNIHNTGNGNSRDFYNKKISTFLTEHYYGMNGFFGSAPQYIPEAPERAIKETGISLGAKGIYTDRLYLNSWYIIGPFTGNNRSGLFKNPAYPPEYGVDLDAVYEGKDNRLLQWNYVITNDYPFSPPDMAADAVYYGFTEIRTEQAQDVYMWFGADDDLQVWLNDDLVWAGGNTSKQSFFDHIFSDSTYRKSWNLTEGKKYVHLAAGKNKLLFKLSNGPNSSGIFSSIIITQ